MQFWEAMFYSDVQNHIRALYLETEDGEQQNNSVSCFTAAGDVSGQELTNNLWSAGGF